MKIEVNSAGKMQKEILVSLTPKEMEQFLINATRQLSIGLKVRGFREGHIPRNVAESAIGKDKLWQEASKEAIKSSYIEIIEKENLHPIGRPWINILKLAAGNNFEFKITIPIMPQIDMPDYKQIAKDVVKKKKKDVSVEEQEINDSLKWLQKSRKDNDTSEFDDKFAQSVGSFKTLEELKSNIKEGLKYEKEQKAQQRIRLEVLDKIAQELDLEVPEILLQEELDKMQNELEQQVAAMDMTLDKYLENAKQTIVQVRNEWEDTAKTRVLNALVLRLIADKENIEPDEKEVEERANRYLMQFKDVKDAEKNINPDYLRLYISGIIRNEKVFELLEAVNVK